jgi:hypothetical protein
MMKGSVSSTIGPYFFRNAEDKRLYKNHYRPSGDSWNEVVRKYGNQAAKKYYGQVDERVNIVDKQLESDNIDREALWIGRIDHRLRLNVQKCFGNARRANDRLRAIRAAQS